MIGSDAGVSPDNVSCGAGGRRRCNQGDIRQRNARLDREHISYPARHDGRGTIRFYDPYEKDGSPEDIVDVPVILRPMPALGIDEGPPSKLGSPSIEHSVFDALA